MAKKNRTRFSRRTVLKTAGVSLAGLSAASGVGAAGGPPQKQGTEAVGITNAVDQLLLKGKVQKAARLLEKHDIKHDVTRSTDPIVHQRPGGTENDESVSIQDEYTQGDAEIYLTLYNKEADIYTATNTWNPGDGDWGDGWNDSSVDEPADPVAIYWSDTYWQPVQQGSQNFTPGNSQVSYEDYYTYGVSGKFDDASRVDLSNGAARAGSFQTDIERLNEDVLDEPANVTAEYRHTWSSPFGVIDAFSFSLGPAGISIDNGFDGGDWEITTTKKA